MNLTKTKNQGFTLIELLVVISIIGLLASVIIVATASARTRARIVKAQADIKQISTGLGLLESDTGKWPLGCPPNDKTLLAEADFNSPYFGLTQKPTLGQYDPTYAPNCTWTAQDLARWLGPYLSTTNDPWGSPYFFDPDFYFCGDPHEWMVILSKGPDKKQGSGPYLYPTNLPLNPACVVVPDDDIILNLFAK